MNRTRAFFSPAAGLAGVVCVAALLSCAGAQLSDMWRDPTYQVGPMRNVLVIAMKQDPVARRIWEDGFAAELASRGTHATPSYEISPDALPDTMAVVDAVEKQDFDGVLIVHRRETETLSRDVPGYTANEPVTRYDPWLRAYRTFYQRVYHPGYTETERQVRHEVNIWTTKEGSHLVWAGTAGLIDPQSQKEVREKVVKKVVKELVGAEILPKG